MKFILLLILGLISTYISSQSYVYTLDPHHTKRKLKETKSGLKVYSVISKNVVDVYGGVGKKVINKEYVTAKTELKKLIAKKNTEEQLYSNQINASKKITNLIENFLHSEESFLDKQHWLIDAQNISDKYKYDFLIFANNEINTEHSSKFKTLKVNGLDLKVHLKRIEWEIESLSIEVPENIAILSKQIDSLKSSMEGVEEYKILKSKPVSKKRKALFAYKAFNLSENSFEGEFVPVSYCFIVRENFQNGGKKLKKGELIKTSDIVKRKSIDKEFLSSPKILFRKKNEKILYLTSANFFKDYAFMINGKFNK